VAVGDEVVVYGTSTGTDTVSAGSVVIMQRPAVVGTVATAPASSTGSFTVTAWKQQTVTVDLTGSTSYTERGVTSPGYSDVAVGDEVVVYGTSTGTDTFTASSVVIIQRPAVTGKVATAPSSSSGSFTVTAWQNQTWTVDLSGSTTYLEWGVSSPSYSDVAVGDQVVVYGTSTGTDTVAASSVVIMSHGLKAPPSPWAVGHVSPSPTPALTGLRVGIGGTTPPDGWSTPHGGGSTAGGSHHQGSQGDGRGSLSGGAHGGGPGTPGR
jgi:peroxiredoxin family protein